MKLCRAIAFALFMMATSMTSPAQPRDAEPEPEARRIASRFVKLAGSEENALALVLALRHGLPVQLFPDGEGHAPAEAICIEIDAASLPWNEVRITLLHVQDVLVRAGHTRPHLDQVRAALLGGEVTLPDGRPVALRGVLPMRNDGLSWVDVARESAPLPFAPPPAQSH